MDAESCDAALKWISRVEISARMGQRHVDARVDRTAQRRFSRLNALGNFGSAALQSSDSQPTKPTTPLDSLDSTRAAGRCSRPLGRIGPTWRVEAPSPSAIAATAAAAVRAAQALPHAIAETQGPWP